MHQIFGYLDPESLLAVARVCRRWNMVSEDSFFWQKNLAIMRRNHTTFCSCGVTRICGSPNATLKQEYYRKVMREQYGQQQQAGACSCEKENPHWGFFKAPLSSSTSGTRGELKVVIFGPGLDGAGADLVYDLMWDQGTPFKTLGMFPNSHSGIGGGVKLQYKDAVVNLVTLYRATKKEREVFAQAVGPRLNRIIDSEFMIQRSKVVASTADAFIYVCDGRITPDAEIQREFEVLVGEASAQAPILLVMPEVAATTADQDNTCSDYVDALKLTEKPRRWWMQTLDVQQVATFVPGIDWLLKPAPAQVPASAASTSASAGFFQMFSKLPFSTLF